MASTAESVGADRGADSVGGDLIVFDDPRRSAEIVAALAAHGYRASPAGPGTDLRRERPALVIVSELSGPLSDGVGNDIRATAAEGGAAVLVIADDTADPRALAERLEGADDWVTPRGLATELPARVARLLKRRDKAADALPADAHFLALMVHDLRTPLNVIGLSLRMLGQALPKDDAEVAEDLRFVDENFRQIERMLTQLSDYFRLFEVDGPLDPTEFSPRRLVDELLESRSTKAGVKIGPVQVDLQESCPAEVALDPLKARLALHYALANATVSSGGHPIRLTMRGGPGRWVTEVAIDHPPPPSVKSVALGPRTFERLCGLAAERRGMDLAIAAKVSDLFGGTARLDVDAGRGTTVVLDWPARLAPAWPGRAGTRINDRSIDSTTADSRDPGADEVRGSEPLGPREPAL